MSKFIQTYFFHPLTFPLLTKQKCEKINFFLSSHFSILPPFSVFPDFHSSNQANPNAEVMSYCTLSKNMESEKWARLEDWGLVWFRDSSVFKTHNSNLKLITPYSNLTSLKNYKTPVWTHNSVTFLYNFLPKLWTPPTDTTQYCLLLLPASLHLYLSIFSLPSTHSHSLAPSTTTNQSTTTNPTTSHQQPLQTDPPPQTQQPSTKPIHQPSTKSKPIYQNKNKTHQQNPSTINKIHSSTIDKIKIHSSK